jgi:AAA domain
MADCTYYPVPLDFRKNDAEERLFGSIILQLPEEVTLFHSMKHFDSDREYEIDFIVCHPELGIAVLEVKGSDLKYTNTGWQQYNRAEDAWHHEDIRKQLGTNKRWIMNLLIEKFGNMAPPVRGFLVAPDATFRESDMVGEFKRNRVIDRTQIENFWEIISESMEEKVSQPRFAYGKIWTWNEQIDYLRDQFHTYHDSYEEVIRSTQERGLAIDSLSKSQVALLDFMGDNTRMLIRGGPGSGKTVLAIEQAARLAAQGQKTGLLCYNIGLSQHLIRATGSLPKGQRLEFRGSLDDLIERWSIQLPPVPETRAARDRFYRNDVPRHILEQIQDMPIEEKFDAWIVDEAQELHRGHWKVLRASLKDPDNGIIHAFGDKDQEIFQREENASGEVDWHNRIPWFYARGNLRRNLRNSRVIARLLAELSNRAAEPAGLFEGFTPEYVLVPDHRDIHDVSDSYVDYLLMNYPWDAEHILVLNTGDKSPRHLSALKKGKIKYWERFIKPIDAFHSNVSVIKGLERPVVVLVLDEFVEGSNVQQQLYVGLSRALDDVVLIGKQKELDQLGDFLNNFAESPFGVELNEAPAPVVDA